MKRILLALTIASVSTVARAQIPVTDALANAQLTIANTNGFTEIAKWVQQLDGMARQYQELQMQYTELVNTYDAIEHTTSVSGLAGQLGGIGRTFMPAASSMGGLMGGNGGLWGSAPQLMASGQYFRSSNNDVWQQEMTRRQQVTANAAAMSLAEEQDAQRGIANLNAMKARIESGQNGTENVAVGSYIALEQQRLDANRAQLQGIQAMLAADDRLASQRREQIARKDAEDVLNATSPVTSPW